MLFSGLRFLGAAQTFGVSPLSGVSYKAEFGYCGV